MRQHTQKRLHCCLGIFFIFNYKKILVYSLSNKCGVHQDSVLTLFLLLCIFFQSNFHFQIILNTSLILFVLLVTLIPPTCDLVCSRAISWYFPGSFKQQLQILHLFPRKVCKQAEEMSILEVIKRCDFLKLVPISQNWWIFFFSKIVH